MDTHLSSLRFMFTVTVFLIGICKSIQWETSITLKIYYENGNPKFAEVIEPKGSGEAGANLLEDYYDGKTERPEVHMIHGKSTPVEFAEDIHASKRSGEWEVFDRLVGKRTFELPRDSSSLTSKRRKRHLRNRKRFGYLPRESSKLSEDENIIKRIFSLWRVRQMHRRKMRNNDRDVIGRKGKKYIGGKFNRWFMNLMNKNLSPKYQW